MRDRRFLTRFAGAVPPAVAVYRPAGIGLGAVTPTSLGIAHFALSAVAQLEQETADLANEESGLLAAAEAGTTLSQEQWDRLGAIQGRLPKAEDQLASLRAARERRRSEPTTDSTAAAIGDVTSASKPATPFGSLGEFLMAVKGSTIAAKRGGQADARLLEIQATSGALESAGVDGGYIVQKDISNDLLDGIHDTGILAGKTRRIPIGANSNGLRINVVDETSRVDGSRWGGVLAYWEPEATTATATKPKFKPLELTLGKLLAFFYASDELLQDATALSSVASTAFTEEIGFKVDDAIVRGTGSGIPLGWLNAPALVSVSKETGQAGATVVAENVEKMYSRMPARNLGKAEWYINQEIWPQLFQLAHVVGTGGVPLFVPAGGLSAAPFGTLLGRPIVPIEQASALGTVGDINFVDLNEYLLIEKGGVQEASSIHVEFLTDQSVFRWVLRTNGQPRWSAAMTPYKGSATQSPFIALATRA